LKIEMTSQESSLRILIEKLNQEGIGYMLAGSYSSSLHGGPRATNDADIVIAPSEEQLASFIKSLGDNYYVNMDAALDALKNSAVFNVIDVRNSFKVDFIILKDRPFSREEFDRRQKANVIGLDIWVVSPEDVILGAGCMDNAVHCLFRLRRRNENARFRYYDAFC
jgi:hypothetical protein